MALIPLYTRTRLTGFANVDDADFAWAIQFRWWRTPDGYAARRSGNRELRMHRELLGLKPGDGQICDHINRVQLDNRRSNLRVGTVADNAHNRRTSVGGAFRTPKGRWRAQVTVAGGKNYLGTFDSKEAALAVAAAFRAEHCPFSQEARAGEQTPLKDAPRLVTEGV